MTIDENLAAIERDLFLVSNSGPRGPFCQSHVNHDDVRWLIAEVRRLQGEYARGRAEERRDITKWMLDRKFTFPINIEHGEHVAGKVIPIGAPPELIAAGHRVAERLAQERGEHLEANDGP